MSLGTLTGAVIVKLKLLSASALILMTATPLLTFCKLLSILKSYSNAPGFLSSAIVLSTANASLGPLIPDAMWTC